MVKRQIIEGISTEDRKKRRQDLGTLKSLVIRPTTVSRYEKAFNSFLSFLRQQGDSLSPSIQGVDAQACEYLEWLWEEGLSLSLAGDCLSSLQYFQPSCRKRLQGAWKLLKVWQLHELPARAPPFTLQILEVVMGRMAEILPDAALGLYVAFRFLLRTGELLNLENRDILAERRSLLKNFPTAKKTAVVLFGKPDEDFRDWVKQRTRSDYEAAKEQLERRRSSAEAAGEEPPVDDLKEPPEADFLPSSKMEVSDKVLAHELKNFSLPDKAEGFDEIRYEWADEAGAKAGLLQWLREQKARRIVEGLSPGEWFEKKFKDWKEMRRVFQNGQREFSLRSQNDDSLADKVSAIELSEVQDPHNADGEGTPIYGNFKYEDWVVLSWRYELHLLSHAFPIDASDSDRLGVPEEHMEHYWRIYYHHHFEPRKLGAANLRDALKVLKEPIQLKATTSGSRILVSACDQETSIDAFVVSVEAYRRDRCRRIEAGDESAALNIPRQNKAPGPEGKATGKGVMKSAPKTPTAKPPQPSSSPAPPGGKAAPKAPVAKMPAQPQNSGGGEAKRPHPPNNGPPTKRTNPPEGHLGTVNHQVKKAAESKVLWFCGEVGGQAPSAFFLTGTNWRQGTTKSSSGKNTSKAPAEFCRWRGESQSCGGEDASKAATSAKRRATYQEVQVGGTRLVSVGPLQLFIV
eukprot:s1653_g2.t1